MIDERREHTTNVDPSSERSAAPEADTTLLPEDVADSPAESPVAVDDYGVTAGEESRDEPLTQRLRRETPETPRGHRPTDPDRLAATRIAGRLVTDDGAHVAEGGTADLSPEEAAMHLAPGPRGPTTARPRSRADRLELLEAQVAVLLTMARIHTEALRTLAEALERLPTEEPDEAAGKVSHAARTAHELLLSLRNVPE